MSKFFISSTCDSVAASTSSWWLLHSTWPLWSRCDFNYLQQIWCPCQSATTLYILKKCRHFSKNDNKWIIKQTHFSKLTSNLDNWQNILDIWHISPHFGHTFNVQLSTKLKTNNPKTLNYEPCKSNLDSCSQLVFSILDSGFHKVLSK
jgi:hypothetical protein